MKILNLLLFLLPFSLFAQIKVYEGSKPIKIGNIQTHSSIEKKDDIYTICFQDIKFTKITSFKCFSFQEIDNDFENLYNMISKGFEDKTEQVITLDLPNNLVDLKFVKNMGLISFQFITTDKKTQIIGFSPYYSKKQINKLFGKSEK